MEGSLVVFRLYPSDSIFCDLSFAPLVGGKNV